MVDLDSEDEFKSDKECVGEGDGCRLSCGILEF